MVAVILVKKTCVLSFFFWFVLFLCFSTSFSNTRSSLACLLKFSKDDVFLYFSIPHYWLDVEVGLAILSAPSIATITSQRVEHELARKLNGLFIRI